MAFEEEFKGRGIRKRATRFPNPNAEKLQNPVEKTCFCLSPPTSRRRPARNNFGFRPKRSTVWPSAGLVGRFFIFYLNFPMETASSHKRVVVTGMGAHLRRSATT